MDKVHYTSRKYLGWAACDWSKRLTITEVVDDVTCKRCLNAIAPPRTLEELKAAIAASKTT